MITNHYPAKSFGSHTPSHTDLKDFFTKASKRGKSQTVISSGGHIHAIGCKTMQGPVCVEMLSGGGGGCCDKNPVKNASGFYAVHFDKNKDMYTKQISYPYHISAQAGFPHTQPLDVPHPPDVDEELHSHYEGQPHYEGYHYEEDGDAYQPMRAEYYRGYGHHHHGCPYGCPRGHHHRGCPYTDDHNNMYQPTHGLNEYYRGPLEQLY